MPVAFNLGFTLIPCAKCGFEERVAGIACANCGAHGRKNELNDKVVNRRRAVREVRSRLSQITVADAELVPFYIAQPLWRPAIGDALDGALESLAALADAPTAEAAIERAVATLDRLNTIERNLNQMVPRRPYVGDLAAKRTAASCLTRMSAHYLDALTAATPIEAQAAGARAQAEIDLGSESLNRGERELLLIERLAAVSVDDILGPAIESLSESYPGKTLFDIDADQRAILQASLGREIAPGQGASYAFSQLLATAMLDRERFDNVVAEVATLFQSSTKLIEIAAEAGALESIRRARESVLESAVAFDASLAAAANDEARLRRTMNFYREIFEDAAAPLFAWLLRLSGAKTAPFSKLMSLNSTALLASIKLRPDLVGMFFGADSGIRTAASHGQSYTLDGQDITISTNSNPSTITVEVLVDLLLALIESLLAVLWVLDNELAVAGVEGHNAKSSLIGESWAVVAKEVLRQVGAPVVDVTIDDSEWVFQLARGTSLAPFICAGAVGISPPQALQAITIVHPDHVEGLLEVPKLAALEFARAKDRSKLGIVAASLDLLYASRLNGLVALNSDHVKRASVVAAITLLVENDTEAIAFLRRCSMLGKEFKAEDISLFCSSALVEWRSPEPERRKRLQMTMSSWNLLPIPSMPYVRMTTLVDLGADN